MSVKLVATRKLISARILLQFFTRSGERAGTKTAKGLNSEKGQHKAIL
jgi:hypothetical protein